MAVLWLNVAARGPHPLTAGHKVWPARIAVPLAEARAGLERSHARLEQYREPPDPTLTGWRARIAGGRHRQYLEVMELLGVLDGALGRGEDVECGERSPLGRRCGWLVLNGRFTEATCPACSRAYTPGECRTAEWSSVAGPRAGVGGSRLACPDGHTLFVHETWVA